MERFIERIAVNYRSFVTNPNSMLPLQKNHAPTKFKSATNDDPLIARLHRALGPLAGGMILDAADFVTMGPIGLFAGLIVGGIVGWWISSIYDYSASSRSIWAILAGIYCTIPFTSVIPLATLVSAIGRYRKRK